MQIDWSTFVLELINFLVLVWLLRHFLYQPVLNVLHQRRARVAEKLAHARRTEEEASARQQAFAQQVADWQQQQDQQRLALQQELLTARNQALEEQQQALALARAREQAREEHQRSQWQQNIELRALRLGARFSSTLLTRLAGPDLEARLLELFLEQWPLLDQEARTHISAALERSPLATVRSAYTLAPEQRQRLQQTLCAGLEQPLTFTYEEASELLSGIELIIGSWHLHANLAEELRFFAETAAASLQEAPLHDA